MGTPFIIVVFAIIFVCIAMALVVVGFMRTNSGLGDEEQAEQNDASLAQVDGPPHGTTGPLPAFMPLPHQTQPLSEIYYYDEHSPQPSAPLAPLNSSTPEAEAPPPHMPPPTGPLPSYSA